MHLYGADIFYAKKISDKPVSRLIGYNNLNMVQIPGSYLS